MQIILTTVAKKKDAEKLAKLLVVKRIAACVNIIRIEKSVYRWKGKIVSSGEFLLLIKTARKYNEVEQFIKKNHPYKLAEIISIKMQNGSREYLEWISS